MHLGSIHPKASVPVGDHRKAKCGHGVKVWLEICLHCELKKRYDRIANLESALRAIQAVAESHAPHPYFATIADCARIALIQK